MLSFELSDFIWVKGRTLPIKGRLHDEEGNSVDLSGKQLTMMIQQGDTVTTSVCTFEQDILVALRTCPAPTQTYPNDDVIFGDANFEFLAVLLPGNYLYLQETGEETIYPYRIHFVNDHYLNLFAELPAGVDAGWKWWASDDSPTRAERGSFEFTPSISTMIDGPFDLQAKIEDGDGIDFSVHMTGRRVTPIQPQGD